MIDEYDKCDKCEVCKSAMCLYFEKMWRDTSNTAGAGKGGSLEQLSSNTETSHQEKKYESGQIFADSIRICTDPAFPHLEDF